VDVESVLFIGLQSLQIQNDFDVLAVFHKIYSSPDGVGEHGDGANGLVHILFAQTFQNEMRSQTVLNKLFLIKTMESRKTQIGDFLKHFEANKSAESTLRGIYVYGPPGSGKTTFVHETLKQLDYDVIAFNAGDVRNKTIMESITMSMSSTNIVSMFHRQKRKTVLVMDEIECMNNGDKGGINSLIKLVRPKKTKKQKEDLSTHIPIVCIGSNRVDKKVKELMKCCLIVDMPKVTAELVNSILTTTMPGYGKLYKTLAQYALGDLKKLEIMCTIVRQHETNLTDEELVALFEPKILLEDAKVMTKRLINKGPALHAHQLMNDTERTIVSLLWHENVTDVLEKAPRKEAVQLYLEMLGNMSFADYIDRITFQKQIWQFNEMSSLIKTYYSSLLLNKSAHGSVNDVRFTKVLTKYSTEYNNTTFITRICQELGMEKHDLLAYVYHLKQTKTAAEIVALFNHDSIRVIDINRLYRYIKCDLE
jgi:uridine kinase